MDQPLNSQSLKKLRDANLISQEEVAFQVGDLLIAENVITKARRILGQSSAVLLESSRTVLKG